MLKKLPLATCWLTAWAISASVVGCTSSPATSLDNDGGGDVAGGSSGGGSEGGRNDSGVAVDGAGSDTGAGTGLGLLVDNMTAMAGTQVSLQVPASDTPGSYYTYEDLVPNNSGMLSRVLNTAALVDAPVSPPITNADGSQIAGELCFFGSVVSYAGLGMSLAYGNAPDAAPESGLSSPVPFDASHYSGVSFYILVEPTDGSIANLHFGVPDTQTADPVAWPTTACAAIDAGGASDGGDSAADAASASNPCDDDFGANLTFTPGNWTKVSFKWTEMQQDTWGAQFPNGLKTDQLIGMKWQVNGPGVDAPAASFSFCISDIYLTP